MMNKPHDHSQGTISLFGVIGEKTRKVASRYVHLFQKPQTLFDDQKIANDIKLEEKKAENEIDSKFKQVAQAFISSEWNDDEAGVVLEAFFKKHTGQLSKINHIDFSSLIQWIQAHPNSAEAVKECIQISPPDNVQIRKLLSMKGNQKNVFLAMWPITQKLVVLKKLRTQTPQQEESERQSHPLSIRHPNIIETFNAKNSDGELFLLEEFLPEVLHDSWHANGIYEAANLLYNISSALSILHGQNKIHGDVKPDNIGKRGDRYILLDFGTCRSKEEYQKSEPVGSLKTRAPELLLERKYQDPAKADVWALGATIYNTIAKRFPLLKPDEKKFKGLKSNQISQLEQTIVDRATNHWDEWLDFKVIPEPLDDILICMLKKEPEIRASIEEVIALCNSKLIALLRTNSLSQPIFSLVEELKQLSTYFPDKEILGLMSATERTKLKVRLEELSKASGFDTNQLNVIQDLLKKFD